MTLDDVIRTLALRPHPEGGWYAETHRIPDPHDHGHRSPGTAIYYLLEGGKAEDTKVKLPDLVAARLSMLPQSTRDVLQAALDWAREASP